MQLRQFEHVNVIKKKYPDIWRLSENAILYKGKYDRFDWEDEIFIPRNVWAQLLFKEEIFEKKIEEPYCQNPEKEADIDIVAALGAWRMTMGIYRFDDTLAMELIKTDQKSTMAIPPNILTRLPEWCLYLDLSNILDPICDLDNALKYYVQGVYVHLDRSTVADDGFELRFVFDVDVRENINNHAFLCLPLFLGFETLEGALNCYCSGGGKYKINSLDPVMVKIYSSVLSLLIYICSESVEYENDIFPQKPMPKKTKKGIRFFCADRPKKWNIGFKIGSIIKSQMEGIVETYVDNRGITRSRPRAHIRRAHFHGYWSGPKSEKRNYSVKWLPPILVNTFDSSEIIPTIHKVTQVDVTL